MGVLNATLKCIFQYHPRAEKLGHFQLVFILQNHIFRLVVSSSPRRVTYQMCCDTNYSRDWNEGEQEDHLGSLGLNVNRLESDLQAAVRREQRYWNENDAKFRAVYQKVATYDDFKFVFQLILKTIYL